MHPGYAKFLADPAHRDHLDRIARLRATAFAAAARGVGARLSALVGTIAQAVRGWRRMRETRHALAALDDRALRDIGLTRSDIAPVVEAVRRAPERDPLRVVGLRARTAPLRRRLRLIEGRRTRPGPCCEAA